MGFFSKLGELFASPLGGLAKDFTEARKIKKEAQAKVILAKAEAEATILKAEAELKLKQAEHSANWEITQAQQASKSWKDEFLTVLLYIPVGLTFATIVIAAFPGSEHILERMYTATDKAWDQLNHTPEWYRYLLFACASAVFGLRLTDKFKK